MVPLKYNITLAKNFSLSHKYVSSPRQADFRTSLHQWLVIGDIES